MLVSSVVVREPVDMMRLKKLFSETYIRASQKKVVSIAIIILVGMMAFHGLKIYMNIAGEEIQPFRDLRYEVATKFSLRQYNGKALSES